MFKKAAAVVCASALIFSQLLIPGIAAQSDKRPPAMNSSIPSNGQMGVLPTTKISVKYKENIYKAKNFKFIKVTSDNKKISISCIIKGRILYIAHKYLLKYDKTYILTIPAGAIKDKSGNLTKKALTIKFLTQTTFDPSKLQILFIGNSRTFWGQIPESFNSLAQEAGQEVQVFEKCNGGYSLEDHLNDFLTKDYKAMFERAGIVILQGNADVEDDAGIITKIQSFFKSGTKFYYLLTEYSLRDDPQDFKNIPGISNLSYIPTGYAFNSMLKNGFTLDQLIDSDMLHPTKLYGYFSACAVYSVLFDISCMGLPYDFLDSHTKSLIPGNEDQKDSSILSGQICVDDAIELLR